MPIEKVIKHSVDICEAIDYAHQRGLIHRDLKPANVLLDVHDQAILMDFGIAKIIGGQLHTATGAVIGTARYMSPEQIKGLEIDPRTDIYSLGVTLFEMVNGKPPFEADSAMSLMMMHVNDPIPDLRQLKPDLPPKLYPVIEKALSKDRDQRYHSASEMARALREVLAQPEAVESPTAGSEPQPGDEILEATLVEPPLDATIEDQPKVGSVTASGTPGLQPTDAEVRRRAEDQLQRGFSRGLLSKIESLSPAMTGSRMVAALILIVIIVAGAIFIPQLIGASDEREADAKLVSSVEAASTQVGAADATEAAIAVALERSTTPTDELPSTQTATPEAGIVVAYEDTVTSTPEPTAIITPKPTQTTPPSATPSPTLPTDLYVAITGIGVEGNYYVVDYETYGYREELPGTHVHFFFDTVPVEQAGSPGSGPWILYGGPRPFTEYRLSDRPAGATQMCARVANPDHSLYHEESGNCYDLPPSG
jgi:hypothetical protein